MVYLSSGNTPAHLERNDVCAAGILIYDYKNKIVQFKCNGSERALKYGEALEDTLQDDHKMMHGVMLIAFRMDFDLNDLCNRQWDLGVAHLGSDILD